MKILPCLIAIATGASLSSGLSAATAANLMNDSTVKAGASYLYFSAASGVGFLAQAYYPGAGGNPNPDGSFAAGAISTSSASGSWIPFSSGELTDGLANTKVDGWAGYAQSNTAGPYILFDLGGLYNLDHVTVSLEDATGYRWSTGTDAQAVWTASSLSAEPGTGVALDSGTDAWAQQVSFTATAITNSAETYTIQLDDTRAVRYVLLKLAPGTVDSHNAGGVIRDVSIYGYAAIPEPGATAALIGAVSIGGTLLARGLRRR